MKNLNLKDKNVLITIAIILILIIGGLFVSNMGKDSDVADDSMKEDVLPDIELVPTVDDSVVVTVTADRLGQEVTLEISGVPAGTEYIEYELSYDALVDGEPVPKGAIGTIEFEGKDPLTREVTLGTCSSGTCKYDKGVESISVTLKFETSSGAMLFEGEFEI